MLYGAFQEKNGLKSTLNSIYHHFLINFLNRKEENALHSYYIAFINILYPNYFPQLTGIKMDLKIKLL